MAAIGTDVGEAIRLLANGELVAIPTETVYGLAANALDVTAVTNIFLTKQRPSFDPLIVHVKSIDQVEEYALEFPAEARLLADHFWPGPLTIVLQKKKIIPDIVTSGLDTVGIRCPDHNLALELLGSLNFPLAAPSANPFGYVSPTIAQHVSDQLGDKIKYILDGGRCSVGLESTIVGFENREATIYRRGGISEEAITTVIGKIKVKLNSSSNPVSPGQLESHYSPKKKFILGNIDDLKTALKNERTAILKFQGNSNLTQNEFVLSPAGNLEEAARNLFALLRQLDKLDVDVILAEQVPDEGIGKAINDRLQRASAAY